ncbi:hypothetical protein EON63_04285 [archaeon]|nr:MAG: hypothetical protein EON63_04285 [archaeon]
MSLTPHHIDHTPFTIPLELDKTYVKAWAKKGDIEFFMKEYHKSMDSYKAGLQIEPDNSLCKQVCVCMCIEFIMGMVTGILWV